MVSLHVHDFDSSPEGLSELCQVTIQGLGHRGHRPVYETPGLARRVDSNSKLKLYRIDGVIKRADSVLIGCGTPNLAVTVSTPTGWKRMNAFMFWRDKSYVANTRGELQVGGYFELRHVPEATRQKLLEAMVAHTGLRGPSCAHLNAEVLDDAGFTLGNGERLTKAYRPSKLGSLIWRHGLLLNGEPVDMRVVNTTEFAIGDQFKAAWKKEVTSVCRTIQKQYLKAKAKVKREPIAFQPLAERVAGEWGGPRITVLVNRPTWLGVMLGFLWGRHPEFRVRIPGFGRISELSEPLLPFGGKPDHELDRVTRLKRNWLFRKEVIDFINRIKIRGFDRFENVPLDGALEMMGPKLITDIDHVGDRTTAALWNIAVIDDGQPEYEVRMTPLKNLDPLSAQSKLRRVVNWILAKHVALAAYHPNTVYASESWACRLAGTRKIVLGLNTESGTYQPDNDRLAAITSRLNELDIETEAYPYEPAVAKANVEHVDELAGGSSVGVDRALTNERDSSIGVSPKTKQDVRALDVEL